MRLPSQRGTAVDPSRVDGWVARFQGYRQLVTRDRVNAWLGRFKEPDLDLAARVLDSVDYVGHHDLETALRAAHQTLAQHGWQTGPGLQGKWRFAAFSTGAGESGDTMLHKFRVANGLTGKGFKEFFVYKTDLLKENLGPDDTVVLVDDISGSGDQATDKWPVLKELLPGSPRIFLVLAAIGLTARARILADTKLIVVPHAELIELDDDDDIFSPTCGHFTQDEKNALLKYCRLADDENPRGWRDCGFVIVFAHRCPDNSIPVLHARNPAWDGLFER